jgi:hypothetical protein
MWVAGDSLMIGATDAAGIALLAGHDSLATKRAKEIDDRAARFLATIGTDSVAESFMHASIPTDARRAYLARLRSELGDSASSHVVLVGTAVDSPTSARSYVRLTRGGDDEVIALVWNNGMLVGVEPGGRAAYPLALRAEGDDALTSFDLFTGHLVHIDLLGDRELAIESNGIKLRASR